MLDLTKTAPRPELSGKLTKFPTGIAGFDEIAEGGLPDGRLVAIMGGPGTGKTVFALQTIVNRARLLGTGGLFVCFEESPENLRCNANGFSWGFGELEGSRIFLYDGRLSPDTVTSGDIDLSGLLAQIGALAEQIGATTVVLDGLDMLLSCLSDVSLERRELLRISRWVNERALSCVITGKNSVSGPRELTRQDYLHFISDLVIELDGRMYDSAFARQIRIVKYRGSNFSPDAFPAVIDDTGFLVIAKTKARHGYPTFDERLSSGVPAIDELLGGGYRRGTTILASGAPGTAKTSLAGSFALAGCRRGEKTLYVSFDQSDSQLVHDLRSIGVDLEPYLTTGKLVIAPLRAASRSAALNYTTLCRLFEEHEPTCLIVDPISALIKSNFPFAAEVCDSLLDEARSRGITTFCTSLAGLTLADQELSISDLSSVADTWLHLTYNSRSGERNRAITIVKSRGTAHSNQVRELVMGIDGIDLFEVYTAEGEVLMGTARAERESAERQREVDLVARHVRHTFELTQALASFEMQAGVLQQQIALKQEEIDLLSHEAARRSEGLRAGAAERLRLRETTSEEDAGGKA